MTICCCIPWVVVERCMSAGGLEMKIFSFTRRWIEMEQLYRMCTLTDHNGLLLLSYILYVYVIILLCFDVDK